MEYYTILRTKTIFGKKTLRIKKSKKRKEYIEFYRAQADPVKT